MQEHQMLGVYRQNGFCDARDDEPNAVLHRALRKILTWRIPSNWSAHDWSNEVKAIIAAARCHAELDYDSKRGVPLSAFLYQRALTSAWTRYRQEWAYCLRFTAENYNGVDEDRPAPSSLPNGPLAEPSLQCALTQLPQADQWLIEQLYWNETTEDRIAKRLRITQQAVSKRKRKILEQLSRVLRNDRLHVVVSKVVAACVLILDSFDFTVLCEWPV